MKNGNALRTVLIMAVAVLAIGGGLVYWQWSARSAAASRVATLEMEVPDGQELENNLAAAEAELELIQEELDHLQRGVPSIAYVPTLLKEIEAVGLDNQILVTGVRPVPKQGEALAADTEEQAFRELEIDITGQGSYQAVMDLIAALHEFPKILAVHTLQLSPRVDRDNPTPGLDAVVRLRAYVFDEEVPAEDDESEASEVAMATEGGNS